MESSSESSELTVSLLDESELDDEDVSDVPVVVVAVVAVVPFVVVVMLLSCEPRRDGLRFSSTEWPAGGGTGSATFKWSFSSGRGAHVGSKGCISSRGSSSVSIAIGSGKEATGFGETGLDDRIGVLRFKALMLLPERRLK